MFSYSSEVRVEGLDTLDYLDNLQSKKRCTEQGDAVVFESEVSFLYGSQFGSQCGESLILLKCLIVKVDRVYLSAPPKIVTIDHEKKRTFVLRKKELPDVGKLASFF
jgi:glucose-6-phosphate 1-epimerase